MKTFVAALSTSILALSANAQTVEKPAIVLVHGAFENDQVWGHVSAKLQKDGYQVVAVDLPGRPGNPATPDKVSLDLYRDTVVNALGSLKRPAVVVGHSFGGIVILPLHPKRDRAANRIILRAQLGSGEPLALLPGLVLHQENGAFTPEADSILRDGKALPMRVGSS